MADWWDTAPTVDPLDAAVALEGLDPQRAALARSIYQQESSGGRNTATSNAGARGGMQIIPETFGRMADKGWSIDDPLDNARAGVRYVNKLYDLADGDPRLAAAGYYGGEGAISKARAGRAVSDPRNPNAPNTLQYADQVASRLPPIDSGNWWESAPLVDAGAPAEPTAQTAPTRVEMSHEGGDPTFEQQVLASAPGRVIKGVKDLVDGGAQMLAHAVPSGALNAVNDATQYVNDLPVIGPVTRALGMTPATPGGMDASLKRDEEVYQAARTADGQSGFDAYRLGGNMAGTYLGARMAGPMAVPANMFGKVATGGLLGSATGMMNPVLEGEYSDEKVKQGLLGGAFGAAGSSAGALLGRALSPNAARNPEIQALMREGITPTPGQLMGGMARTVEDKAMSLPIVGDAIRAARTRGVNEVNTAALNRAMAPLGTKVTAVGREGMEQVDSAIKNAYNTLLPKLSFQADAQFSTDLSKIRTMAQVFPDDQARQLEKVIKNQVLGKMTPQGAADGQNYKAIESELSRMASGLKSDPSFDNRNLGMALDEILTSLRGNLQRSNPQAASELQKINKAYSEFTILQRAAGGAGAINGVFSPAQLSAAVRQGDGTMRKNSFARGNAQMQDLGDASKNVMAGVIPNSGTADRAALGLMGIGSGMVNPAIPAGLLGASIPYLPGVSKAVAAGMASRPQGLLNLGSRIEGLAPAFGGLLGLGAAQ